MVKIEFVLNFPQQILIGYFSIWNFSLLPLVQRQLAQNQQLLVELEPLVQLEMWNKGKLPARRPQLSEVQRPELDLVACGDSTQTTVLASKLDPCPYLLCHCSSSLPFLCFTSGENTLVRKERFDQKGLSINYCNNNQQKHFSFIFFLLLIDNYL